MGNASLNACNERQREAGAGLQGLTYKGTGFEDCGKEGCRKSGSYDGRHDERDQKLGIDISNHGAGLDRNNKDNKVSETKDSNKPAQKEVSKDQNEAQKEKKKPK